MARLLERLLRWFGRALLRMVRSLLRATSRQVQRTCFGTWRRTLATAFVGGLVASRYYPQEVGPIFSSLLTIAVTLFGIRVMFAWAWPLTKKKK